MPRLTCSASLRRCALQGGSSDQGLQMPMIGRPSNGWWGMRWFFIKLGCMKPFLSALPNHSVERSLRCGGVMVGRRERSGGKGWWRKGMAGAGGAAGRGRALRARAARAGRRARGWAAGGGGWAGGWGPGPAGGCRAARPLVRSMVRGGGSDLVLVVDIHQHGGEQHHALDDLLVVDAYAQ